ncbi:VOC family protein [Streptomyces sp. NPDC048211]|uniref:VOC family protein n=1 Tax=Streptomyces sp. NPDC048211 TaxID=3365516 RepID=UPI003711CC20
MNIIGTAVLLTIDDPASSARFFVSHLGYREVLAAEGTTLLSRDDAATDLVLSRHAGPGDRQPTSSGHAGVAISFAVTGIHAEYQRLRREGARITLPVHKRPWGEWALQLTDPNGLVIQLVEWVPPTGA